MNYESYTAAIKALLDEVNGLTGLDLEIHPGWSCPILDARTISVGYKLHRRTGEPRTMSLAVDTFSGFDYLPDGSTPLTAKGKAQLVKAIEDFWSAGNSARHTFVEV